MWACACSAGCMHSSGRTLEGGKRCVIHLICSKYTSMSRTRPVEPETKGQLVVEIKGLSSEDDYL